MRRSIGRAGRTGPVVALVGLLGGLPAHADEGHWRPEDVASRADELVARGLELDPGELGRFDGLLSAVVDLGGCSGAFVSDDGLVATAFHCVSDALQHASREGEDLFESGFYAAERDAERAAGPALSARVTLSRVNVTLEMQASTRRLDGRAKFDQMERNEADLVRRCEARPGVRCKVVSDDQGGSFHLVSQLELRDLRLVYAPPRAVGYFGGEQDNWRWPRHSGDFAFLRAYSAPDGRAAEFSDKNVPYRPAHHLVVASRAPAPGELVVAASYPAVSWRWRTAAELNAVVKDTYPRALTTNRELLAVLADLRSARPELAPSIATRELHLSNDAVYLEGNLAGFERSALLDRKMAFENAMAAWIEADPQRTERFGDVLETIDGIVGEARSNGARDARVQALLRNSDMLMTAMQLYTLAAEGRKKDPDRREGYRNRDRPALEAAMSRLDGGWNWRVDRALFEHLLLDALRSPEAQQAPALRAWLDQVAPGRGLVQRVDAALNQLYGDVSLDDGALRRRLMETSTTGLERTGNPWFQLAAALHPTVDRMVQRGFDQQVQWKAIRQRYLDAVEEFVAARPDHRVSTCGWYPDANDTLRISWGSVAGYDVRDGLVASPRTTVQGVVQKQGLAPYDAPEGLLAAIAAGNWGPYAVDGTVPVDFVSDTDTARGSSGGPTLDAKGRFVGVVFDGNEDGMHSDWVFDTRTRTVHTDVSYMLWYLDAVAGARGLLEELGHNPAFTASSGR